MNLIRRRCLGLSKKLVTAQIRIFSSSVVDVAIDPNQAASFDEPCILVNEKDEVVGRASKRDCHLVGGSKNHDGLLLHRAFSVFLFNSKGEMLMQRRSKQKVTFPGEFSNACCSHPLYTDEELEENGKDGTSIAIGVKRAASRRLEYELGIPTDQTQPGCFMYLTRFHYHSLSGVDASQKSIEAFGNIPVWGEHEIDYILILRGDMEIKPNPNEVMEVKLISREGLVPFLHSLSEKGIKVTPWFKLVVKHWLPLWWENLHQLEKFQDFHTIHKL
ncbi:isopentenyl-diphosphate Delta-isomerase 1 [Ischnura elegans]|uniref:isopentenyl-diphosphate Delta-isomerase 1 n=1 Tax=Ischnura elegans TaxID=197161 RepID=UPI001ED8B23C|nr:isopentenyl-diphosphate Delta-isomerase 1 [Ischnura elegans]